MATNAFGADQEAPSLRLLGGDLPNRLSTGYQPTPASTAITGLAEGIMPILKDLVEDKDGRMIGNFIASSRKALLGINNPVLFNEKKEELTQEGVRRFGTNRLGALNEGIQKLQTPDLVVEPNSTISIKDANGRVNSLQKSARDDPAQLASSNIADEHMRGAENAPLTTQASKAALDAVNATRTKLGLPKVGEGPETVSLTHTITNINDVVDYSHKMSQRIDSLMSIDGYKAAAMDPKFRAQIGQQLINKVASVYGSLLDPDYMNMLRDKKSNNFTPQMMMNVVQGFHADIINTLKKDNTAEKLGIDVSALNTKFLEMNKMYNEVYNNAYNDKVKEQEMGTHQIQLTASALASQVSIYKNQQQLQFNKDNPKAEQLSLNTAMINNLAIMRAATTNLNEKDPDHQRVMLRVKSWFNEIGASEELKTHQVTKGLADKLGAIANMSPATTDMRGAAQYIMDVKQGMDDLLDAPYNFIHTKVLRQGLSRVDDMMNTIDPKNAEWKRLRARYELRIQEAEQRVKANGIPLDMSERMFPPKQQIFTSPLSTSPTNTRPNRPGFDQTPAPAPQKTVIFNGRKYLADENGKPSGVPID